MEEKLKRQLIDDYNDTFLEEEYEYDAGRAAGRREGMREALGAAGYALICKWNGELREIVDEER